MWKKIVGVQVTELLSHGKIQQANRSLQEFQASIFCPCFLVIQVHSMVLYIHASIEKLLNLHVKNKVLLQI